jgi:hypothetical protein
LKGYFTALPGRKGNAFVRRIFALPDQADIHRYKLV